MIWDIPAGVAVVPSISDGYSRTRAHMKDPNISRLYRSAFQLNGQHDQLYTFLIHMIKSCDSGLFLYEKDWWYIGTLCIAGDYCICRARACLQISIHGPAFYIWAGTASKTGFTVWDPRVWLIRQKSVHFTLQICLPISVPFLVALNIWRGSWRITQYIYGTQGIILMHYISGYNPFDQIAPLSPFRSLRYVYGSIMETTLERDVVVLHMHIIYIIQYLITLNRTCGMAS